jgi:hypothetical protein
MTPDASLALGGQVTGAVDPLSMTTRVEVIKFNRTEHSA